MVDGVESGRKIKEACNDLQRGFPADIAAARVPEYLVSDFIDTV